MTGNFFAFDEPILYTHYMSSATGESHLYVDGQQETIDNFLPCLIRDNARGLVGRYRWRINGAGYGPVSELAHKLRGRHFVGVHPVALGNMLTAWALNLISMQGYPNKYIYLMDFKPFPPLHLEGMDYRLEPPLPYEPSVLYDVPMGIDGNPYYVPRYVQSPERYMLDVTFTVAQHYEGWTRAEVHRELSNQMDYYGYEQLYATYGDGNKKEKLRPKGAYNNMFNGKEMPLISTKQYERMRFMR